MRTSKLYEIYAVIILILAVIASIAGLVTVGGTELYLLSIMLILFGLGEELRQINEDR